MASIVSARPRVARNSIVVSDQGGRGPTTWTITFPFLWQEARFEAQHAKHELTLKQLKWWFTCCVTMLTAFIFSVYLVFLFSLLFSQRTVFSVNYINVSCIQISTAKTPFVKLALTSSLTTVSTIAVVYLTSQQSDDDACELSFRKQMSNKAQVNK